MPGASNTFPHTWCVRVSPSECVTPTRSRRHLHGRLRQPAGGTAQAPLNLGGIISLLNPTIGLANTKFQDGKLVLTVGIEVSEATIFGGIAGSKLGAKLTGILGTFDIEVDLMAAIGAISNPSALASAFSVPGKFGLNITTLEALVPNVLKATANGIRLNYDPNYKAAGQRRQAAGDRVVNRRASSSVQFDLQGTIEPFTDDNDTATLTDDKVRSRASVIRDNGFQLGEAELIFRPGTRRRSPPAAAGPARAADTAAARAEDHASASILEFDDLRIGVQNFGDDVRRTASRTSTSTATSSSRPAASTFLPGQGRSTA